MVMELEFTFTHWRDMTVNKQRQNDINTACSIILGIAVGLLAFPSVVLMLKLLVLLYS